MRSAAIVIVLITVSALSVAIYRADLSYTAGDGQTPESQAVDAESGVLEPSVVGPSDVQSNRPAPRPPGNAGPRRPGQAWSIDDLLALNASGDELFSGNAELAQLQRTYSSTQKIFVFPDGETITLTYDSTPRIDYEGVKQLDDGVSAGFFDPLSEAARDGNANAAHALFQELKFCAANAASTREQLSQRIQALGNAVMADGPSVEERIVDERRYFRRCEGTNAEMMGESLELLRLSADAGDYFSTLLYANEIVNSHPESAEKYYRQAWKSGGMLGLHGLSRILGERAHASYEDAVIAYAHRLAWLVGNLALDDGLTEEIFKYQRERLLIEWKELQGSASYPVVLEGTALAREIIVNNPRCCTPM